MKRTILAVWLILSAGAACGASPKKEAKSSPVQELTTERFREKVYALTDEDALAPTPKYLGDKPAVIDFYASWCGPCRTVSPILEKLAGEFEDRIVVYKVNVDREPVLAAAFGIRSIPTILLIPLDGKAQRLQGAMPEAAFRRAIESCLLK